MKGWLALTLLVFATLAPAHAEAARVALQWQASVPTAQDRDLRYVVFTGPESRPANIHHPEDKGFRYPQMRPVKRATRWILEDLQPGERRVVAVIAIDDLGRSSNYSDEIIVKLEQSETGMQLQVSPGTKNAPSGNKDAKD